MSSEGLCNTEEFRESKKVTIRRKLSESVNIWTFWSRYFRVKFPIEEILVKGLSVSKLSTDLISTMGKETTHEMCVTGGIYC